MLVKNEKVGVSLLTMVPYGGILLVSFKNVTGVFESYARINQNNGEGGRLTGSKLATKVNNDVAIYDNLIPSHNLLNHVLKNTSIEFNAQVHEPVEYKGEDVLHFQILIFGLIFGGVRLSNLIFLIYTIVAVFSFRKIILE